MAQKKVKEKMLDNSLSEQDLTDADPDFDEFGDGDTDKDSDSDAETDEGI